MTSATRVRSKLKIKVTPSRNHAPNPQHLTSQCQRKINKEEKKKIRKSPAKRRYKAKLHKKTGSRLQFNSVYSLKCSNKHVSDPESHPCMGK